MGLSLPLRKRSKKPLAVFLNLHFRFGKSENTSKMTESPKKSPKKAVVQKVPKKPAGSSHPPYPQMISEAITNIGGKIIYHVF